MRDKCRRGNVSGAIPSDGVQVLSTEGMIRRPTESANKEFIVATETGILYRLRRANRTRRFSRPRTRPSAST